MAYKLPGYVKKAQTARGKVKAALPKGKKAKAVRVKKKK